jgi:putative Mn2+ efflux pump MntP
MTRIIAQLTLLLIGVAFLTSMAKAQNDTVPILNSGNSINVTKIYWNGIATEYNRLKLESSLSKEMIKSLTDQLMIYAAPQKLDNSLRYEKILN